MTVVILDPEHQKSLISERRGRGLDRYDEVWNGIYIVPPYADNEHQFLCGKLHNVFSQAIAGFQGDDSQGVLAYNLSKGQVAKVYPAVRVSYRSQNWKRDFRCPDVSVFLPNNHAKDKKSHWLGGPDFVVEVITPRDHARKKLGFYAKLKVRELLLIDRHPWSLELHRLDGDELRLVAKTTPFPPQAESTPTLMRDIFTQLSEESPPNPFPPLASQILPLSFRLTTDGIAWPEKSRPTIEIIQTEDARRWLI